MFKGKVVRKFRFDTADGHRKSAWVKSMDEYKELYKQIIEEPEIFWTGILKPEVIRQPLLGKAIMWGKIWK
ncbi:MAG: hypothetical protein GY730_06645 [bacterium]|nr:hypothetical protein [bacterium]